MIIAEDSTLVYDGERYVVLNVIIDNDIKYGIASKYDENDVPIIDYLRVFRNDDMGKLVMVDDKDLLGRLLPRFQDNLNAMISEYQKAQENN